jgi:hypothetical protein
MNEQLHNDIRARLDRDFGFEKKQSSNFLQKGKCPSCGKKEMYASAERPWVLRCGRASKCGAEYHVKELYPDLFESWSERHRKTPEAPNAAADAYLRDARGFDLARIAGWYAQESYYDAEKKIGSATVRFALAGGAWWERIIDQPGRFGSRKATFHGQYAGTWWAPPSLTDIPEELWIVEGIFDAIAWLHHDVAAVAAMSCNNYPGTALAALAERCKAAEKDRPRLVWALDGDKAGRKFARQWAKKSREEGWEASAATIPFEGKAKLDWNDMHQRGRLGSKDIERYRYHGALLLAESAQEKALLMYRRNGWNAFSFEFDNRLHWFKLDLDRYHKVMEQYQDDKSLSDEKRRDLALTESGTVSEIANCYPTALYYQANLITDESWYYFRVDFPHDGPSVNNTFTGGQLASPSEFKKRMLSIAPGAVFTGTAGQLDAMLKRWLGRIKTVETVDFIGYSAEHQCWVFNDVAVKAGKLHAINDEDYFDIGRLSVKSLSRSLKLRINADLKEFSTAWMPLLWQCYQYKGVVALAFWLGSLFAEQIRDKQASYPFLELVGEPGAGKTTLIEFLWKLCGRRSYEGFDPARSSIAARARNFSQVSNLPVVLIESDRGSEERDRVKQKSFDWEELKNLYDGGSIYSRGVKNTGNDTYEPPFRGAIVIAQNARVQAHEAIMQRLLHVDFDLASHSAEGKAAGEALKAMDIEAVSGFILKATLSEAAILATMTERIPHHERRLAAVNGVKNDRIVKNHAQLAALVDALAQLVPIGASELRQTQTFIEDMALERQESINDDHPVVQEFWDAYDYINGDDEVGILNHHRKSSELIAINFPHFIQVASERRQQLPDLRDLKKLLKTSRVRKFIDIRPVNSVINARYNTRKDNDAQAKKDTVDCWVFENTPREPSR